MKNLIHEAFLIISFFCDVLLGLFIYLRKRDDRIHISFAFYSVFLGIWPAALYLFMITDGELAIFWMKMAYFSAMLATASLWYFSIIFPDKETITKKETFFLFIPTTILILLIYIPNFLTKGITYNEWGKGMMLGKLEHSIYGAYILFFYFGACARMYHKYKKYTDIYKQQSICVLISVFTTGIFGVFFNLILPSPVLFDNHKYIWLGPIFTVFISVGITYAIINFQLLEIKIILKRTILSTVLFITVLVLLNTFIAKASLLIKSIAAIIILFGLEFFILVKLKQRIERKLQKIFPDEKIDLAEFLEFKSRKPNLKNIYQYAENTKSEIKDVSENLEIALAFEGSNRFHIIKNAKRKRSWLLPIANHLYKKGKACFDPYKEQTGAINSIAAKIFRLAGMRCILFFEGEKYIQGIVFLKGSAPLLQEEKSRLQDTLLQIAGSLEGMYEYERIVLRTKIMEYRRQRGM